MYKYALLLILGIFTLVFSTFFAWYEGSAIIDIPWEWNYSTPFSKLFNIEIVSGYEISQLDYFVYAAKYQPLFPIIMLLSMCYILSIIGYYLVKHHIKQGLIFLGVISCTILSFGSVAFNSSTIGGRIFFSVTLIIGFISAIITVFAYLKSAKIRTSNNTN